jgi:hypothetical protein
MQKLCHHFCQLLKSSTQSSASCLTITCYKIMHYEKNTYTYISVIQKQR